MSDLKNCFGFYGGDKNAVCEMCAARTRCKSILVSNGFDAVADQVEAMIAELDEGLHYCDTDQLSNLVGILNGTISGHKPIQAKKQTRRKVNESGESVEEEISIEEAMLKELEEEIVRTTRVEDRNLTGSSSRPSKRWTFENL